MTNVTQRTGNNLQVILKGEGLIDQYEITEIPYSQNITDQPPDYTGVIWFSSSVCGTILFLGLVFIVLWYKSSSNRNHVCLQTDKLDYLEKMVKSTMNIQKQKLEKMAKNQERQMDNIITLIKKLERNKNA
jgi:hypothetical protein